LTRGISSINSTNDISGEGISRALEHPPSPQGGRLYKLQKINKSPLGDLGVFEKEGAFETPFLFNKPQSSLYSWLELNRKVYLKTFRIIKISTILIVSI
jgi:hypothetical protein